MTRLQIWHDEYEIFWDFIFKQIKLHSTDNQTQLVQQAKARVSDYWFGYSWWSKHNYQGTRKIWQVQGLKNRIAKSLECQGSGHYR